MYRVSNALIKKLAIILNNTLHNTQNLCTDHINLRCMFHYNIILPICTYYSPFSHFLLLFAGNIPEKCFFGKSLVIFLIFTGQVCVSYPSSHRNT